MNNSNYKAGAGVPTWVHAHWPIILLIALWSILWKGLALWHSARKGQTAWFIILLIINTAGILEIVYLFAILRLTFSRLFSK